MRAGYPPLWHYFIYLRCFYATSSKSYSRQLAIKNHSIKNKRSYAYRIFWNKGQVSNKWSPGRLIGFNKRILICKIRFANKPLVQFSVMYVLEAGAHSKQCIIIDRQQICPLVRSDLEKRKTRGWWTGGGVATTTSQRLPIKDSCCIMDQKI